MSVRTIYCSWSVGLLIATFGLIYIARSIRLTGLTLDTVLILAVASLWGSIVALICSCSKNPHKTLERFFTTWTIW